VTPHRLNRARCAGSIYLTVLGCSMLLTVIGLGSLLAVRVQRRLTETVHDSAKARLCAQSAIDLGLGYVAQDSNWRNNMSNGAWLSDKQLGDATLTLEGIDPEDNDLADSEYDTLVLTGIGVKGIARHKSQVTLVPVIEPLDALNTCLHASDELKVKDGKILTVVGAPASTNGVLKNDEIIDGDAEAVSVETAGTVTGTLTSGAAVKTMPDADLFDTLVAKATAIGMPGNIAKQVLTATHNPWGSGNAEGIYYINTAGGNINLQDFRLEGTLLIDAGSGDVMIEKSMFMESPTGEHPVLFIKGRRITIKIKSLTELLDEDDDNANYNPPGAPYQGLEDEDQADVYPNVIRGLVHVICTDKLALQETARIEGVIICEGKFECDGQPTIVHDPSLHAISPEGYTYISGMKISPGSYKQVVD